MAMLIVKSVILGSGMQSERTFVTEDACKDFVTKFKERKEPIYVTFGGQKQVAVGKLIDAEWDEKQKRVIGVFDLGFHFQSNIRILNALETPEGKRVLDCTITQITLMLGGMRNGVEGKEPDEGNKP